VKFLVQGYCTLYQYHYLKYLTVEMINNNYQIGGSEAAADDGFATDTSKTGLSS
jgi:hypothetical protein